MNSYINKNQNKIMKKKQPDGGNLKYLRKMMRIMKLSLFLIVISTALAFSATSYSQSTKLTLDLNASTVKEVLKAMEKQCAVLFFYQEKHVDLNRQVTLQVTDRDVETILNQLFAGTDNIYVISDRQIVIGVAPMKELEKQMLNLKANVKPVAEQPQQKEISGRVTDTGGLPLPGVSVIVKGTTIGTVANADGEFSLSIPLNAEILRFSFVGMISQEVAVKGRTIFTVEMKEETIGLDEVVAVGYGVQKKATLTGSVGKVEGDKLTRAPVMNISNSLAGQIPGLFVVQSTSEPGRDDATIRVRGTNTLNNNSALIVVDGIANRSLTNLNASDIESITVLKDASAAIYGAQAANGVILVTTKRGALEDRKAKVNFTFNSGLGSPTVLPKFLNSATYAQARNEIQAEQGKPVMYTDDEIQKFRDGLDPWLYPDNNYREMVFRDYAPQYQLNGSATGGSNSIGYYISGGYKYQDAIYKESATNYSQADFRGNIDGKISNDIKLSFDISGKQIISNLPNVSLSDGIFDYLMLYRPDQPLIWPNGLPGLGATEKNPVTSTSGQSGYDKRATYELQSNFKLNINVPWIKGLSVTGNAAFDYSYLHNKTWNQPYALYTWDKKTYENGMPKLDKGIYARKGFGLDPSLEEENWFYNNYTLNALINYSVSIAENHNFKLLLGTERNKGKSNYLMAYRRYFQSTSIQEIIAGGSDEKTNNGYSSLSTRLNYFGRLNYDYLEKYLVELIFRYDGSYIFPEEGRYGFFPGISAGWRVSEENFWKNNFSFINYFKLRASYGKTGNDRIDPYQYLASYGFAPVLTDARLGHGDVYIFDQNKEHKILNELRIPNNKVTWEVANQSNIGFDGSILNGKLNFSAEYFYNLRTNILHYRNASVPQSTGLTLPRENIGEVVNQGFEAEIDYYGKTVGGFSYGANVNIGYAKNYIKFWDETPGVPEYQQSTGMPIGANLLYKAIGIFADQAAIDAYPSWPGAVPGDIIFKDVNNDGEINGLDRVRMDRTSLPTLTGGLSVNLGYKNFYANMLFQGASGAVRYRSIGVWEHFNFTEESYKNRWTPENTDSNGPRLIVDPGIYWYAINNTFYNESNDYVRLKNVEIGYNFTTIKGFEGVRIYFSGQNLVTFSGIKDWDPETSTYTAYPLHKIYNVGFSLTF